MRYGWKESNVLSQFYAHNQKVNASQVMSVTAVLDGKAPCDDRIYYMFSLQDTQYLGITKIAPIKKTVRSAVYQIWYFERFYQKRKK